ncbi:MAG: hypothetical protein Fues2KO_09130 [Fuerstiella sp.]
MEAEANPVHLLLLLVLMEDPGSAVPFVANASTAAFFLWPIAWLGVIGWVSLTGKRFSQRRRTSRQRRLLPAASISLIALVGIPLALLMYHNLHDSDLQIHIPAIAGREAEVLGIDASRLRQALALEEQTLLWAGFQWITYRAAWVFPTVAVTTLLLKSWLTEVRRQPTASNRGASILRCILLQSSVGIIRSAPVLLLISFSIHLAALPTIQRSIDTRDEIYRHRMLVPESVWSEFAAHSQDARQQVEAVH